MNTNLLFLGMAVLGLGLAICGVGFWAQRQLSHQRAASLDAGKIVPVGTPTYLRPHSISGRVTDEEGNAIVNAIVTVTAAKYANAYSTMANDQGVWVISMIWTDIDSVLIRLEAPGYESHMYNLVAVCTDALLQDKLKKEKAIQ